MSKFVFDAHAILGFKNAKDASPERIGLALSDILAKNNGDLKPQAVVDAARAKAHPLHRHFEWDDKVAGEQYRLQQARMIIRAVKIEDKNVPASLITPARAFLSISERNGVAYKSLGDVLSSASLQARVLHQALQDLLSFEARYKELDDICSLVRSARERLSERIASSQHDQERRPENRM